MRFAREEARFIIPELDELVRAHWEEVGHYPDMPIDPDYERYRQAEKAGVLRAYTARETGHLVGYAAFILGTLFHYRTRKHAQETTVYFDPARRGPASVRFLHWCDDELRREGVQFIARHVKVKYDPQRAAAHQRLLERMGYEAHDLLLTRRLA